jgi:hypothetical protein
MFSQERKLNKSIKITENHDNDHYENIEFIIAYGVIYINDFC